MDRTPWSRGRSTFIRDLALIVLPASAMACVSDPYVRVDAAVFAPSIDGDVALGGGAGPGGSKIDLESDLDLGDTDYVPLVRGELDLGPLNLAASAFQTSQGGSGVVTGSFGGIAAGSTVTTDLDLTLANGRLVYDLVDTDLFGLGIGVGADWIDLDLEATEVTFGLRESVELTEIVPMVAARASTGFVPGSPVRLEVDAAGITANYGDLDGTMVDAAATLRAEGDHLGVFAGYRYVFFELDGSSGGQTFDGDVRLAGWFAGLNVRF